MSIYVFVCGFVHVHVVSTDARRGISDPLELEL